MRRVVRFFRKRPRDQARAVGATLRFYLAQNKKRDEAGLLARIWWRKRCLPYLFRGRSAVYVAIRPDSDLAHHRHEELALLASKWVYDNVERNTLDIPRLYSLVLNVKQVLSESVPGHFAELGVYKGNSAAVLAHFSRQARRTLFLFDTFEGFSAEDLGGTDSNKETDFADTSLPAVQALVGTDQVTFVKGRFPDSVSDAIRGTQFAIVHVDCDLYEPTKAALDFFYPRMPQGGMFILHDYGGVYWDGVKLATDEFVQAVGEQLVLMPDKSGSAIIRKSRA